MNDTITISRTEYANLLADSDKLARLEAYGVDNWVGYGEAMRDSEGIFEDEDNDSECDEDDED